MSSTRTLDGKIYPPASNAVTRLHFTARTKLKGRILEYAQANARARKHVRELYDSVGFKTMHCVI